MAKNLNAPEHWAEWIKAGAADPGSPMQLPRSHAWDAGRLRGVLAAGADCVVDGPGVLGCGHGRLGRDGKQGAAAMTWVSWVLISVVAILFAAIVSLMVLMGGMFRR